MSVVCAGELLVDGWPDGACHPGGAPANVALHAAALGASSILISRVGSDESAAQLRRWLQANRIEDYLLQTEGSAPTGVVRVRKDSANSIDYDIVMPVAWDFLEANEPALVAARRAGVFVFGTLAQRHPVARRAIRLLVEAARGGGSQVIADLNLRPPFYDEEIVLWTLRHGSILKLNREELSEVSRMLGATGEEKDLFLGLLREFGLKRGVLTAGSDGAWIFEDGELSHQAPEPAAAVDAVGAGDGFCAALAVGLVEGKSLRESAPRAARVAAFVVSHRGATPPLPPGL